MNTRILRTVRALSSQLARVVCPFESRQAHFHNISSEMRVVCVPVLRDNFAYLLIDESGFTAAVDPAQPEKVRKMLYLLGYTSGNLQVRVRPSSCLLARY